MISSSTSGREYTPSVMNKFNQLGTMASNTSNKISEQGKKLTNGLSNSYQKATNTVQSSVTSIGNSDVVSKMKNGINKATSVTEEFSEKNSYIAKTIFIIFVFIMFGLLFRLGIYILSLFFIPSKNPIVLDGMRSALTLKEYHVNPNKQNPVPILRSINENQGMEFTWSSWIWINNANVDSNTKTEPRIFFTKGKSSSSVMNSLDSSSTIRREFMMSSPGLFLYDNDKQTNNTNAISIVVSFFDGNEKDSSDTTSVPYEVVTITNMPMQKWVNVIIRVQGRILDVYINGTLTKRKEFDQVIKQNYGNIYVGDSAMGVDGYLSSLRYYDHAIGTNTIQDILYNGPNLKMEGSDMTHTSPPYLSMRWYLNDT